MRIEPLSKKTLQDACALLLKTFDTSPGDNDYPPKWFKISLEQEKHKELLKKEGETYLQYYVAVDDYGKVIGTTGVYTLSDDEKDSAWLGWFCVDEKHRGKGFGEELLEYSMQKARDMGKSKLKLYTSTEPSEEAAQKLYAKKGFVLIGEETIPNIPYKKLYKQINL